MTIKSTAGVALAAVCLTASATLSGAHAQMGGPPPGSYWAPPAPYGYAPGHYGPPPSPYAPQSRYAPPSAGTQLITNGPQVNPGDVSPSWSPQRNVAESEQYDRLLKTNPAFRQARMRKECGPITDPQLHHQCLESFARY
jgi:hypothetical protein